MNFHQLQYAVAIARNGLSVTQAASALGTSQPAISRALKSLERELGFDLFVREGRAFSRITPQGTKVLEYAGRALAEIESLRGGGRGPEPGQPRVARYCDHPYQARYVLPPVVQAFRERYPDVELHLHQGTSEQIAEMVSSRPCAAGDRHRLGRRCSQSWCCCRCIAGTARSSSPSAIRWPRCRKLTLKDLASTRW